MVKKEEESRGAKPAAVMPLKMGEESKGILLDILDKYRDEIIESSTNWVYEEAIDLRGKRPREETLKLATELYHSNREVLSSEDYSRLDKFIEYVVEYRGKMGFHISTLERGFLSFKKALMPILGRECKDMSNLAEIIVELDSLYEYSLFKMSDRYQEVVTRALVERERYQEDILASIADGLLTHDKDEKINYVNPYFEKLLGREAKDFLGKTVKEVSPPFLSPETLEIIAKRVKERVTTGKPVSGVEIEMLAKDGKKVHVSYSASGIRNNDGKVIGSVVIFRDISDLKRTMDDLEKTKIELEKKIRDLERFQKVTMDREKRVIELKDKVRELEKKLKERKE